ncbi:hypothetical protein MKW92_030574, partial [Papaver armeniacum]
IELHQGSTKTVDNYESCFELSSSFSLIMDVSFNLWATKNGNSVFVSILE